MKLTLRWPRAVSGWLCGAWLAVVVTLTARPFLWHVEYFRSPGAQFYKLLLAALPALALAVTLYPAIRRRGWWRYEPILPAGALTVAALWYEPVASVAVLAIFAACYAVGSALLRRLHLETPGNAERLALAAALGLGVLLSVLFWVGLAGGYYRAVAAALLIAPCLAFRRELRDLPARVRALFERWRTEEDFARPLVGVLMIFAALLLACGAAVALAPSVTFDVLKMHLPAAQYYASRHILQPMPLESYSYYPQGGEILMTVALLLGGQPAAQLLSPVCFALVLLLLYATLRRCSIAPASAVAGCIFGASLPFLHWTGSVAKNDMIMALLQLGGLYAYLRWRESRNFRWILAGAFLMAMSFAVKHVALFGGIPLGLLYLHAAWRQAHRVKALLALAFVLAAFGLEWHVRTYLLAGNPVYPETLQRTTTLLVARGRVGPAEKLWRYLRAPYRVQFQGRTAFESPSDNPVGVVLVLFVPLALLLRRRIKEPAERVCLLFTGVYVVYWASQGALPRYAIVPALLVASLTGTRVMALGEASARWMRAVLTASVAYALLFALLVTMIIEINGPQIRYFAGRIDRSQYLREVLHPYGSLEFLRARWKPGDRVFSVGNCAYAYAPDGSAINCDTERSALPTDGYRFLIAPPTLTPPRAAVLYRDPYFTVYELAAEPAYRQTP